MNRRLRLLLAALSLITGVDGATDVVLDERRDVPAIVSSAGELQSGASNESGGVKLLSCGLLALIAAGGGRTVGADALRTALAPRHEFSRSAIVPAVQGANPHYVANALTKSDDKLRKLIEYLAEEASAGSVVLERVNVVADAGNLVVTVRGLLDADEAARLDQLMELVAELLTEKMERAALSVASGASDFEGALQAAVQQEVEEGRLALRRALEVARRKKTPN